MNLFFVPDRAAIRGSAAFLHYPRLTPLTRFPWFPAFSTQPDRAFESVRHDWLQLAKPLSDAASACIRAQHRFDFASARRASRAADAVERRQCRRRGDRGGRRHHGGRAGVVRPRRRRLRAGVGRQEAAWPECVRRVAGGLERRLLQAQVRRGKRSREAAQAWLGRGDGAGRDRRLGSAASEIRLAAVRRSDGAGDRNRRARSCGGEHRRLQMGGSRAGTEGPAGLRANLHAARPRAGSQRTGALSRPREDAAQARRTRPACVLRRRDRRTDRGVCA